MPAPIGPVIAVTSPALSARSIGGAPGRRRSPRASRIGAPLAARASGWALATGRPIIAWSVAEKSIGGRKPATTRPPRSTTTRLASRLRSCVRWEM